jgi:NitT/TauT family transport system permease protein
MRKTTTFNGRSLAVPIRETEARPAPRSQRSFSVPGWRLLLSGSVLILLWQALVAVAHIPPWLLPAPGAVVSRFREAAADGTLWQHLVPTLVESSAGFVVALLVGVTLGYIVAHSPRIERWIAPYLAALQSVPVIAVAPLLVVWTTSGLLRNILVAALVVVFPIFSGTVAGVRGIPRELREVAKVEGANLLQTLRLVEMPLALPTIFSGIRTSLAYATTGAVVAEFVGARYGLGAMINIARGLLDVRLLFVAIFSLVGITLVFYVILTVVERATTAWRDV